MKGVLLVNLGSPDTTETKDVRKYLDEFLMDERVIDMAYWKRFLLVKGIILNTRPKKSGAAYKKIWWEEGSPLVVISERFTNKLSPKVDIPVALGMRYGSMSIENGINELVKKGVTEIFMIPLYPHYAMSSYESVVVKAQDVQKAKFPNVTIIKEKVGSITETDGGFSVTTNCATWNSKKLIITVGTFLNGKMHTGMVETVGGRSDAESSESLGRFFKDIKTLINSGKHVFLDEEH